jgi:signal recognition particle receptor subunit beta
MEALKQLLLPETIPKNITNMELAKLFAEYSLTPSYGVFAFGIAIVILFPILLHFILSSAGPASLPSVLLVGPSGSGKTALATLYERGPAATAASLPANAAQTHTSLKASAVELAVNEKGTSSYRDDLDATNSPSKKFLLVDTPGHAKLRGQALARLSAGVKGLGKGQVSSAASAVASEVSKLKAVMFMVDAAALGEGGADALPVTAEYLHDILLTLQKRHGSSKTSRSVASIPVLIAANKLDLFTALPVALVKSNLEAEITRIRTARSKGLLDSGAGADDLNDGDDWLGEPGSDKFTFDQMIGYEIVIEVVGGSVIGDGPGVDEWWLWMAEKM